ncbi:MAG: DUF4019 domain-containing protein [Ramlibacter sp.]|nr:DUF4019 domain-containing protein [Ramlibacter sp.]
MNSTRFALPLVALALVSATASAQLKVPRTGAPSSAATLAAPAPAGATAEAATAPAAPADDHAADKTAAETAALGWLLLLDRRDWGTAWEAATQVFRTQVPIGTWMDAIPQVRDPLGALVERAPQEAIYKTTMPGRPDGHYVTVLFVSQFANKPDVQEVVTTVQGPDGKWRVTGYSPR